MSLQIPKYVDFASISLIPEVIFDIYYPLEKKFARNKWKTKTDYDLWKDLCLCILASNIPYEQAISAKDHLHSNELLEPFWILESMEESRKIISKELSRPIFLPRKKDGHLRKYRFPNIRAKNIVKSAYFIYDDNLSLESILKNDISESEVRNFLAINLSGIGLKESSHFLRNIGFSHSLAIVDVHIVSFLQQLLLIPKNIGPITAKNYFIIEEIMQQLAKYYDLDLGILDNAIWYYMKFKNQ